MSRLIAWMDRTFYPDFQSNWDDVHFRARILSYMRPEFHVLDIGAGAGIVEQMHFKGHVAQVCGVDLDPRVNDNPFLDEGRVANADSIPYENNRFDLIFANNVMEHLADPEAVFSEIERVLRPGGTVLFKTPNRSHYMPIIARMTPHWFHQYYNRLRGRETEDTFPTHYLANSKQQVEKLASKSGLEPVSIDRIEGRPEYLRLVVLTYAAGLLYERIVNALPFLARYRILLIAVLRKPG